MYTESNNTWRSKPTGSGWELNPAFDVNDDDFLSLDVSELARDRKPDGSLPDVTFLKLDSLSDLIDAGTEVGLPYFGSAPDIGPWEYGLISNPPTVRITSPPHDTSFNINDTIDILVNATDSDGSVVKVEFFVDNVKIGEDTSSPWTYSWTNATLGSYDITAVATDNDNTVAPSQTVRISVGAENVLFPNPNNGNFTILLKDPFDHLGHVNIFSRDGKLVYAESISPFDDIIEINQPNLKAGLYIIRISSDAGLLTRKFIKQ